MYGGAAIAQWIHLQLPFCHPGFESQAHHQRFYQFIFDLCRVEKTKINKKSPGFAHFFKKIRKQKLLGQFIISLNVDGSRTKIFWNSTLGDLTTPIVTYNKLFPISVTRLGNILHFEQLFKVFGNNCFAQIVHISGNFCKVVKIFHLASEIIFGQLL